MIAFNFSNWNNYYPLQTKLISYYPMDSNSNDIVGGHNQTSSTAVSFGAAFGKILSGASFNGTTSKIIYSNITAYNSQPALSASIWRYYTAIGAAGIQQIDIGKYAGGGGSCFFMGSLGSGVGHTGTSTEYRITIANNGGSTDFGYTTGLGLTTGVWYHFCMVYDSTQTGNAGKAKLYVNGVQQTLNFSGTIAVTGTTNGGANLYISNDAFNDGSINGYIDEVGTWNRALTPTEVKWLYNNGVGLTYPFNSI